MSPIGDQGDHLTHRTRGVGAIYIFDNTPFTTGKNLPYFPEIVETFKRVPVASAVPLHVKSERARLENPILERFSFINGPEKVDAV